MLGSHVLSSGSCKFDFFFSFTKRMSTLSTLKGTYHFELPSDGGINIPLQRKHPRSGYDQETHGYLYYVQHRDGWSARQQRADRAARRCVLARPKCQVWFSKHAQERPKWWFESTGCKGPACTALLTLYDHRDKPRFSNDFAIRKLQNVWNSVRYVLKSRQKFDVLLVAYDALAVAYCRLTGNGCPPKPRRDPWVRSG